MLPLPSFSTGFGHLMNQTNPNLGSSENQVHESDNFDRRVVDFKAISDFLPPLESDYSGFRTYSRDFESSNNYINDLFDETPETDSNDILPSFSSILLSPSSSPPWISKLVPIKPRFIRTSEDLNPSPFLPMPYEISQYFSPILSHTAPSTLPKKCISLDEFNKKRQSVVAIRYMAITLILSKYLPTTKPDFISSVEWLELQENRELVKINFLNDTTVELRISNIYDQIIRNCFITSKTLATRRERFRWWTDPKTLRLTIKNSVSGVNDETVIRSITLPIPLRRHPYLKSLYQYPETRDLFDQELLNFFEVMTKNLSGLGITEARIDEEIANVLKDWDAKELSRNPL